MHTKNICAMIASTFLLTSFCIPVSTAQPQSSATQQPNPP
ncbi:hypothetical protein FHW71_003745, partial [Enterobacter sp. Sphag1F]|nr:hypothetical protein [Enterobacter sp. Sphag1F]NYI15519.1 hypothetical protein [Enterobacter sp. Sphag71]